MLNSTPDGIWSYEPNLDLFFVLSIPVYMGSVFIADLLWPGTLRTTANAMGFAGVVIWPAAYLTASYFKF